MGLFRCILVSSGKLPTPVIDETIIDCTFDLAFLVDFKFFSRRHSDGRIYLCLFDYVLASEKLKTGVTGL